MILHDFQRLSNADKREWLENSSWDDLEEFYLREIDVCNNNKEGDFSEEDREHLIESIMMPYEQWFEHDENEE